MIDTPVLALNDGRTMPRFGLGTYQFADDRAAEIVRTALDIGYRLVDTATIYRNERGVGEGLGTSDAFVTTKLWNDRQRDPKAAFAESLDRLGRMSVDLYLIHWPVPSAGQFVDAWKALIELRGEGRARSIGVSNFFPEHIERIADATGVMPAVNQIELHPAFQQDAARAFHDKHGIVTQSWSPLGAGDLLGDPTIRRIADKHGCSVARVILAWHLALGLSVIPKASGQAHLADNFAARDLALDDEDMAAIATLDRADGRIGPDPLVMGGS